MLTKSDSATHEDSADAAAASTTRARKAKPLSPTTIRNAKPRSAPYSMYDARGLYLLIKPNNHRLWRLKYKNRNGKPGLTSLGDFRDVPLKLAREKRDAALADIARGIYPQEKKRADKRAQADTFEAVAREWLNVYASDSEQSTADRAKRLLERDVFPWIGSRPISQIEPPDILECLRRVQKRTLDTAHRALNHTSKIFCYAVGAGILKSDPTRDLRKALPALAERHLAAITEPAAVGELLRAIDSYSGTFTVACALKLAPMWFVRPGELRAAEWAEFDLDKALWTIPPRRRKLIKRKKEDTQTPPHVVPLSTQAIAILRELQMLTGRSKYVFPSARSVARPMSDMALNAALRRLGFDKETMTAHGFRAMARTILDEKLNMRPDIIEHQLAHTVHGPLGRTYNRASFLPDRRHMMQLWSDYLDTLRDGKPAPAAHVQTDAGACPRRHLRVIS